MSSTINITGTTVNEDPTYRYKMPRLSLKVEGRGNGVRTVLVNMADVATALKRPASHPTKFFGIELGVQSHWENAKSMVNGKHLASDLQKLLNVFIDKFVLCPECRLPETQLVVEKTGIIFRACSTCGTNAPLDMSHKLCVFIRKEAEAVKALRDTELKGKDEEAKTKDGGGEGIEGGDSERGDDEKKTILTKMKKAAGDGAGGGGGSEGEKDSDGVGDWELGTSKKGVAAHQAAQGTSFCSKATGSGVAPTLRTGGSEQVGGPASELVPPELGPLCACGKPREERFRECKACYNAGKAKPRVGKMRQSTEALEFSHHASERMMQRNLSESDVQETIKKGKIRHDKHGRFKYSHEGKTVIAANGEKPSIVTAFKGGRKTKRGASHHTRIALPLVDTDQLRERVSHLKKMLSCGGELKEEDGKYVLVLQGKYSDDVVKDALKAWGERGTFDVKM